MRNYARNAGNMQIIYAKLKARGRRGRPGGSEMSESEFIDCEKCSFKQYCHHGYCKYDDDLLEDDYTDREGVE